MKHTTILPFLFCFCSLLLAPLSPVYGDVIDGVSVVRGYDFPGGNYAKFTTKNLKKCIKSCSKDRKCYAFSFEHAHRLCRLKRHLPNKVRNNGVTGGYKLATLEEGRDDRAPYSRDMKTLRGVNLSGGDYDHFLARSLEKCSNRCDREEKCRAFTYNRKKGACWLKSSVPDKRYNDSYISGIKRNRNRHPEYGSSQKEDKIEILREVNLPGSDYHHFETSKAKRCYKKCLVDSRCKAFTYNTKTLTCWLKDRRPRKQYHEAYISGTKYRE